jgi:hypothetical protein
LLPDEHGQFADVFDKGEGEGDEFGFDDFEALSQWRRFPSGEIRRRTLICAVGSLGSIESRACKPTLKARGF